jgi:hypothetical protein
MTGRIEISTEQLQSAAKRLLDHLESVEGNQIYLEKDFFWEISGDEVYDVYRQPQVFTVGQLSESWKNIQDILDGKSSPNAYALVWLADVLRAIGKEVVLLFWIDPAQCCLPTCCRLPRIAVARQALPRAT